MATGTSRSGATSSTPATPPIAYKRHRFPAGIIRHRVRRYHRCGLSLRDVQEVMGERGVAVTHETVQQWCRKVGPSSALAFRRRPRPADTWHLDEVCFFRDGGTEKRHLYRAVDEQGQVLDVLFRDVAYANRSGAPSAA